MISPSKFLMYRQQELTHRPNIPVRNVTQPHALAGSLTLRFPSEIRWSHIVPFRVDRLGVELRKVTSYLVPHACCACVSKLKFENLAYTSLQKV